MVDYGNGGVSSLSGGRYTSHNPDIIKGDSPQARRAHVTELIEGLLLKKASEFQASLTEGAYLGSFIVIMDGEFKNLMVTNVDTPNFKPGNVNFESILADAKSHYHQMQGKPKVSTRRQ